MTNYRDKMSAIEKTVDAVLGRGIDFLIDGEDKIRPVILLVRDHIPSVSRDELKFVLQNSLTIRKGWPNKKRGNSQPPVEVPELPPVTGYFGSSVGEEVCRLLLANPSLSNGKIAEMMRDKIPGAKTTAAAVACYRTALVASEKLQSHRPLPRVGSLICKLLLANWSRSNNDIAEEIRRDLGSRTTANNIANYRNYLRCLENGGGQERGRISKSEARRRAQQCGIAITSDMRFANINSTVPTVWWLNIPTKIIRREGDVTILLYDNRNGKLHCLQVPTAYFKQNQPKLRVRDDKDSISLELSTEKTDLFHDTIGKGRISFAQFHRGEC